mgnify:CR=1 FL=1
MNKFPYISIHDINPEQAEIIEYHVENSLTPFELERSDVIENGLPRPLKEPPVNVETMKAVAGLLHFEIDQWEYSEISFSAVMHFYPDSGYPAYAVLRGGCDYTGWGCQSGADIVFAHTLRDLYRYGLDKYEREKWDITL